MSNGPQQPPVIDPDNIPEILCDGRFNIHPHGNLATLTLTTARPRASELFNGTIKNEEIVRARITMTIDNWAALKDLLARVIQSPNVPTPPAGSPTQH
jgi:hypothetical protein